MLCYYNLGCMTGNQIVIRSTNPVPPNRRRSHHVTTGTQPSTSEKHPTRSRTKKKKEHKKSKSISNAGELAGGTTAEIFVVCCCCPCVVVEFLVLAVYKVPATVVRKVWKTQRHKLLLIKKRKKKHKGSVVEHAKEVASGAHVVRHLNELVGYLDELSDLELKEFEKVKISIDGSAEAVELDQQMWDRFRNAGFWRSPSQRLDIQEEAEE